MIRRCGWVMLLPVLLGPIFARPAAGEITPEMVRDAISRGVAYLKRQQLASGAWQENLVQRGGPSALITLALLDCGVPVNDPAIIRSLDFLRQLPAERTYATSLQTMVFARAEPNNHVLLGRNVRWLQKTQFTAPG